MVKELKEGHLYGLQRFIKVASKNEMTLKYDDWLWADVVYLYLDHCPYSEVHSLLDIKKGKIFYTTDQEHLLCYSHEVIYEGKKTKKKKFI